MIWEAGAEGLKQVQGYLGSIVGVSSCWTTWDPALASLPLKEEGEGGAEKKKGKRGGRESHRVTLCLLPIFLSHWFHFVLNLLRSESLPSSAGFYWVLSSEKRWYCPPPIETGWPRLSLGGLHPCSCSWMCLTCSPVCFLPFSPPLS